MKKFILHCIFIFFVSYNLFGQVVKRDYLSTKYSESDVFSFIHSPNEWLSKTDYTTIERWGGIPTDLPGVAIQKAEALMGYQWPACTASAYLEYGKSGNRNIMEDIFFERRKTLDIFVQAELYEGKGRFLNKIIDGVWATCEESFWGLSAHLYEQKAGGSLPDMYDPIVELFASQTALMLARIHFFFGTKFDSVNPLISLRIEDEVRRRILLPYYERNDFHFFAFNDKPTNNHNTWINSNVLTAILLLENNPELRAKGVYKAMRSTDKYFNSVLMDGWCDEGPSYWTVAGGKLFKSLFLLYKASNGKIDIFDNELVKSLGSYIYKAYIAKGVYVTFADAVPHNSFDPEFIFEWGKLIKDEQLKGYAAFLVKEYNCLANKELQNNPIIKPLTGEFWFPHNQVAGGRHKAESEQGFYFVAKGGHNAESHNHNDIGNCIVFYNGNPVLIDAGKPTYIKNSFNNQRYTLWPNQSSYHNVPTINGIDQHDGSQFAATDVSYTSTLKQIRFSLNSAGSYSKEAKVIKWKRTYTLRRGVRDELQISDNYELSKISGDTYLNFLTICNVTVDKSGLLLFSTDSVQVSIAYDKNQLKPIIEKFKHKDLMIKKSWNTDFLTRVRFHVLKNENKGDIRLIIKNNIQ